MFDEVSAYAPDVQPFFDPGPNYWTSPSLADFMASASEIPFQFEDGFSRGDTFTLAEDEFVFGGPATGHGGKAGANELQPMFGDTELPPIISRRELTDQEIDAIMAMYNAANTNVGTGTGGGSSGPPAATQSLGPDLTIYTCEHLANLEAELRENRANARSAAIAILNITNPFQGEASFNELWAAFVQLKQDGLYNPNDPLGTMAQIAGQTVEALDLLAMTPLELGLNFTITTYQLFMVQSAFAYQANLDRIDEEQARRGGCGG